LVVAEAVRVDPRTARRILRTLTKEGYVPDASRGDRRGRVFDGVTNYDQRCWTSATGEDYGVVVDRILEGDIVRRVRTRRNSR
jgi:hypothetical protein